MLTFIIQNTHKWVKIKFNGSKNNLSLQGTHCTYWFSDCTRVSKFEIYSVFDNSKIANQLNESFLFSFCSNRDLNLSLSLCLSLSISVFLSVSLSLSLSVWLSLSPSPPLSLSLSHPIYIFTVYIVLSWHQCQLFPSNIH